MTVLGQNRPLQLKSQGGETKLRLRWSVSEVGLLDMNLSRGVAYLCCDGISFVATSAT